MPCSLPFFASEITEYAAARVRRCHARHDPAQHRRKHEEYRGRRLQKPVRRNNLRLRTAAPELDLQRLAKIQV